MTAGGGEARRMAQTGRRPQAKAEDKGLWDCVWDVSVRACGLGLSREVWCDTARKKGKPQRACLWGGKGDGQGRVKRGRTGMPCTWAANLGSQGPCVQGTPPGISGHFPLPATPPLPFPDGLAASPHTPLPKDYHRAFIYGSSRSTFQAGAP